MLPNLCLYLLGCTEGHGGLCADGSMKAELSAELTVDLPEIHTFRLHRIENVDACFDQVREKRRCVAAAVVSDQNIRVDLTGSTDDPGQTRLEPLAVELRAHHRRSLHADVVAKKQEIRPCSGIADSPAHRLLRDGVKNVFRDGILAHHVHHQVLHPADVPGGFPDGCLHISACCQAPGVDGFHGSLLRGSVSAAKVGERVGHDFLQAVYPAQRAAQIRHMLGCFASGFMCHAPQIDGGAWFEIRIVGKVAILVEGNLNVGSVSPRHFEIFLIRQVASCTPFVLFFQRWTEIEFSGEPFERFSSEDSQQIFSLIHIGPPFRLRLPLLSVKSTEAACYSLYTVRETDAAEKQAPVFAFLRPL